TRPGISIPGYPAPGTRVLRTRVTTLLTSDPKLEQEKKPKTERKAAVEREKNELGIHIIRVFETRHHYSTVLPDPLTNDQYPGAHMSKKTLWLVGSSSVRLVQPWVIRTSISRPCVAKYIYYNQTPPHSISYYR
ncbi:unnamed protein product, partial [Laminaria digitata]